MQGDAGSLKVKAGPLAELGQIILVCFVCIAQSGQALRQNSHRELEECRIFLMHWDRQFADADTEDEGSDASRKSCQPIDLALRTN